MSVPGTEPLGLQSHKRKRDDGETNRKKSRHGMEKTSVEVSSRNSVSASESSRTDTKPYNTKGQSKNNPKGPRHPEEKTSYHNNKTPHNPLAARRDALQQVRQKLPIYPKAADIRNRLQEKGVLILTAETGSGKSTQVPQFLLSAPWCTGRIAVTQPRRVAAISLARRVAEEMGTPMGKTSPLAKVGYSVRFDDNVGRSNKIKFLTEGMLLQEMLRDPALTEYSCVLVDEVHERSVNVDLILGFLRGLVTGSSEPSKKRQGKPLKVVIMSATADTEALLRFFREGFQQSNADLPSVKSSSTNGIDESIRSVDETASSDGAPEDEIMIKVKGRVHDVQTIYLPEPTQDILEAALLRIFEIHRKEPMPGDILVFLTGQDAVLNLQRSVEETMPAVITLDSGLPKVGIIIFCSSPLVPV